MTRGRAVACRAACYTTGRAVSCFVSHYRPYRAVSSVTLQAVLCRAECHITGRAVPCCVSHYRPWCAVLRVTLQACRAVPCRPKKMHQSVGSTFPQWPASRSLQSAISHIRCSIQTATPATPPNGNQPTSQPTPHSRILPKKLTEPQLINKLTCILFNPTVHHRLHQRLSPVSLLSQIDPVHASPSHLNILFSSILPSTPGSSKWCLSFRFPHQNTVYASLLAPIRATCPTHLSVLDLLTEIIFVREYVSWSTSLCNILYCTVLYCTALYCTVLYCTVLYCTALYCIALYCTVLYCTALHSIVLYCTVHYCTALYCTALYCTVLFCTALVLYCTVLDCTTTAIGCQSNCSLTNISCILNM